MARTDRKKLIKLSLLSPVVSTVSLFYECVISESHSLQFGIFYTGASIGSGDSKSTICRFGITPEYRFYLLDKGVPQGFFIASNM